MLIIFDLDDTLIDTSESITPFKLKISLESLVDDGVLSKTSFSDSFSRLLEYNQNFPKSSVAFQSFAKSIGATDEQTFKAASCLQSPLPEDFKISLTPFALETLDFFAKKAKLALVTSGNRAYQMDKLKKAGIDTSYFCMIGISEDAHKKPFYEACNAEYHYPKEKIWVCGDRLEMDLLPAFELGFKTIHMRRGRGRLSQQNCSWVDFSINDLSELKGIIQ